MSKALNTSLTFAPLSLVYLDYTGALPVRINHLRALFEQRLVGPGSVVACTFSVREGNAGKRSELAEQSAAPPSSWSAAHALFCLAVFLHKQAARFGLRIGGANCEGLMDYSFQSASTFCGSHGRPKQHGVRGQSILALLAEAVGMFSAAKAPGCGQKPTDAVSGLALKAKLDVQRSRAVLRSSSCEASRVLGSAWRVHPHFDARDTIERKGWWDCGRGPHAVLGAGGAWPDAHLSSLRKTAGISQQLGVLPHVDQQDAVKSCSLAIEHDEIVWRRSVLCYPSQMMFLIIKIL